MAPEDSRLFLPAAAVLLVALLQSCASPPRVEMSFTLPARIGAMSAVHDLGIYAFEDDKLLISGRIESLLNSIRVDGKSYFTVHNRDDLEQVLQEQGRASSVLFEDDKLIEIGRLAKVQAVVTGSVQDPILTQSSYQEQRSYPTCLGWKNWKCVAWGFKSYYESCFFSQSAVHFRVRIRRVDDGTVLLSKNYHGSQEDRRCGDPPPTLQELQERSIRQALDQFRKDIAPYQTSLAIELMEEDYSGLRENSEAYDHFKRGIAFLHAKHPNVQRGCGEFNQAVAFYAESAALYYNLGVCAEIEGDIARAKTFFTQASNSLREPSDLVGEALGRVNRRQRQDQELDQQRKTRE